MQVIHQFAGGAVGYLEMCAALDPVQLVQVVGQYAGLEQSLAQPGKGNRVVVDALQ
jgi:hypothetical protein